MNNDNGAPSSARGASRKARRSRRRAGSLGPPRVGPAREKRRDWRGRVPRAARLLRVLELAPQQGAAVRRRALSGDDALGPPPRRRPPLASACTCRHAFRHRRDTLATRATRPAPRAASDRHQSDTASRLVATLVISLVTKSILFNQFDYHFHFTLGTI